MKKRTHKDAIEAIRELVHLTGGDATVFGQSARIRGTAGTPDMYLRWPRRKLRLWFEVKVGRDKLSPAQLGWMDIEDDCDGEALFGDVEVLIGWLALHGMALEVRRQRSVGVRQEATDERCDSARTPYKR